jgi:hypothetical protein
MTPMIIVNITMLFRSAASCAGRHVGGSCPKAAHRGCLGGHLGSVDGRRQDQGGKLGQALA